MVCLVPANKANEHDFPQTIQSVTCNPKRSQCIDLPFTRCETRQAIVDLFGCWVQRNFQCSIGSVDQFPPTQPCKLENRWVHSQGAAARFVDLKPRMMTENLFNPVKKTRYKKTNSTIPFKLVLFVLHKNTDPCMLP